MASNYLGDGWAFGTSRSAPAKRRRPVATALVTALVVLLSATVALADNTISDGDGLAPVADSNLALGDVCAGQATSDSVLVAINRNGSDSPGTNVFKNSSTVAVSVNGTTGTGLTAVMGSPSTINLPSDWQDKPNNTVSSNVSATVTLNTSTLGAFAGSVTFRGSGVNVGGSTLNRDDVMNVTANVITCTPADSTPPLVTISFPAPDGNAPWFTSATVNGNVAADDASNVTAINCTDTASGLTQGALVGGGTTMASRTLSVTGEGTHNISCTATDGASPANTGAATGSTSMPVEIKIDSVAPSISDNGATPSSDGSGGWYISAVTNEFAASDATSGLADCSATFHQSSGSNEGSAVTIPSGSCSDVAGNSNPGINSAAFMIDLTDPTVLCDTPAPVFLLNQSGAEVTATVSDLISEPVSTSASASANTSAVGPFSANVTGYDNAGRFTTVACSYSVVYDFAGFFQPVDNYGWNLAKAGQAIPVKFSLGGDQGLDILKANHPKITAIACPSNGTPDPIEYYETATANNGLVYDALTNQYNYVWKTLKTWSGKCFSFELGLNDGTSHTFKVQFTR